MARKTGDPLTVTFLEKATDDGIDKTPFWDIDEDRIEVAAEVSTLPGWRVELTLRTTETREVLSLAVSPIGEPPEGGITRRALDRLNLGAIVRATAAALDFSEGGVYMSPALKRSVTQALRAQPHPGPHGFPARHYAVIASDYVDRVVNGGETLARFAGRHHMSVARIRNILTTARAKGLLTHAPPGRVGGRLTEEASQLLEQED